MYIGICCLQHNFLLPLTLPLALKYISTKVYLLKTLSLGGQVGNNFPKAEEKMYQNQCIGKKYAKSILWWADTDFCQNSKLARFGFDTETL